MTNRKKSVVLHKRLQELIKNIHNYYHKRQLDGSTTYGKHLSSDKLPQSSRTMKEVTFVVGYPLGNTFGQGMHDE